MKKSFNIGEKGKAAKNVYRGSPLDLILGDDGGQKDDAKKKVESEVKERSTKSKASQSKRKAIKSPQINKPETKHLNAVKNKAEFTDKRRVEDKKKPFSTVLRGSLQKELKETLKRYRQEVDYEYNKAQFMEDAVKRQIAFLEKKIG